MIAPQMQSGLTNRRTGPFNPQIKPVFGTRREGPGPDPNAFLAHGYAGDRNPLEHQAWWAQNGWNLGNNGQFHQAAQDPRGFSMGQKTGWNGLPVPPGQGSGHPGININPNDPHLGGAQGPTPPHPNPGFVPPWVPKFQMGANGNDPRMGGGQNPDPRLRNGFRPQGGTPYWQHQQQGDPRQPMDNGGRPNTYRQGGGYGQNGPGFDPNRGPGGGRRTGGREGGGYGPGGMPFDPHRGPGDPHGGNGGGHNGGGGGQHGGGGGKPGLPLDPYFESQRRILEDQLQAALQPLRSAREQVLASQALQGARLDTNEGVDTDQLKNQMAARGIFGSGIQAHDMGQLGTDYLRQRQDMANAVAGSLGDIASQRAGARGNYDNGLTELLLQLAQRSSADPYAVASMGGGNGGRRKGGHKGGKGGGKHGGKPGRRT